MSINFRDSGLRVPGTSFLKILILLLPLFLLHVVFVMNISAQMLFGDELANPDLKFQHITVADGLPQNTVNRIMQDHLGFLWITTQNGLAKYDGYDFTVYRFDTGIADSTQNDLQKSLSARNLTELLEDHLGCIWVGTNSGGLNKFDPETELFTHYHHREEDINSLSNDGTYTLYEDKNGVLWVGTVDGLNRFNRRQETFTSYYHDPQDSASLSDNEVYAMLEDRFGNFWVGTKNGLNLFNRNSGKVKRYLHDPNDPGSLSHNLISFIYEDKSGVLWIGTSGGGLNRFDQETDTFRHFKQQTKNPYGISSNNVYAVLEDHRNNFWVGTFGGGLNLFDREDERFYHYFNSPNNPHSLSGNFVRFIFEDHSGVLWIGTWLNGLNKLDIYGKKFTHYQHNPRNENSLNNNRTWALEADGDGNLWIGTDGGGLNLLDRKTGQFSAFLHDPDDPHSLGSNKVGVVYLDPEGILWIGTYGGGLNRFDRENRRFFRYVHDPDDPNSLSNNVVMAIFRDSEGYLWIGTWNGALNKLDPENEKFIHYFPDNNDPESISSARINSIFEDSHETLWLGTDGQGLNKYNRDEDNFTRFYDPKKGLDVILTMIEDSRGLFWIGTYRGGLHLFDRYNGTSLVFSEKDGLPNNSIKGIVEDEAGNLWLSTERGLSKFNYEKRNFRNYDVADGLQGSHFHNHAAVRGMDGKLYFGGENGFNSFYPTRLQDNQIPPRLVFTNFEILNQSVAVKEISALKSRLSTGEEIILSHWQNDICINYSALHFSAPEKNRYAFKLENYDQNWRYVGDLRDATYTNLDPGEYIFQLKASNGDGVWNEAGASLKIIIKPPFWQSWWFRMLATIFILSLVFVAYQRKMKNARMKTELRAAHNAQMSIMPQSDPRIEGFDISGICIPANEVGGDFYDYLWLDKDSRKFTIAIGDVSGKAMHSAITAIMTSGMINSAAEENTSVSQIMTRLNRPMILKTDKNMFTVLCLMCFDISSKSMSFTNAGLDRPLHKSGEKVDFLEGNGPKFPLGTVADTVYQETQVKLRPGDLIVLTTDGISESQNPRKQLYGEDTLRAFLQQLDTNCLTAGEIKEQIIAEVKRFCGRASQFDDMTVVVAKVK
ncbi:MAG: two-component regulator propeller domain-containing protein [Calditrichia bacterium]